ncbi:phage tail protein [Segnochrobactrum spirostomi]|nr:tail fiber protein [Segnochrobactrum spirostomi]
MSDRGEGYIGQLMLFAGNYVPKYWMPCEGQLLDIGKNNILWSVIGNTYGGDSKKNMFALPDMRGVLPAHASGGRVGRRTASADQSLLSVRLSVNNLPSHSHLAKFAGTEDRVTVSNAIAIKNVVGAVDPVENGYFGKGGTGTGAASIYVPSGSTAPSVNLNGGSTEVKFKPAGTVIVDPTGPGAPFEIPNILMFWCICVAGIYPTRAW